MAWVRRNLGRPHQLARVVIGLAIAVVAVVAMSGPAAWLLAAAGAGVALTGVVGYCPACAVAGIGSGGRS